MDRCSCCFVPWQARLSPGTGPVLFCQYILNIFQKCSHLNLVRLACIPLCMLIDFILVYFFFHASVVSRMCINRRLIVYYRKTATQTLSLSENTCYVASSAPDSIGCKECVLETFIPLNPVQHYSESNHHQTSLVNLNHHALHLFNLFRYVLINVEYIFCNNR